MCVCVGAGHHTHTGYKLEKGIYFSVFWILKGIMCVCELFSTLKGLQTFGEGCVSLFMTWNALSATTKGNMHMRLFVVVVVEVWYAFGLKLGNALLRGLHLNTYLMES